METISSEDSNSPNRLEGGVKDELINDLESLLKTQKFADVIIRVKENDGNILAHSLILSGKIFLSNEFWVLFIWFYTVIF